MDSLRAVPADFFAELASNGKIDLAMLLKRNGRMLAAWAREPVAWEVVSIMAATTLGSLETMLETIHAPSPETMAIVAGGNRIHVQKVEPQGVLVLVAKEGVTELYLRDLARRLLVKLALALKTDPPRNVTLGPSSH
jgi:predicted regulator of Ras-like GTPase activity (Roadblock/LC7/MglB family)